MSLRALRRQWTMLGEQDPYWAIITAAGKDNNRWDVEEFFSTGVAEIDAAISYVSRVFPLAHRRSALDFGCGAGRLTQALASHFDSVCGVDISPPMIALANKHNLAPRRVEYLLNDRPHLKAFPGGHFDFIYSNITLQHMRPSLGRVYMAELVRVLAPGGALLFQLPTHFRRRSGWRKKRALQILYSEFWWLFRRPHRYLEMHGTPRERVEAILGAAGGRVLDVQPNENAGEDWHSVSYLVTRA
ncbi:MAG TPA: class I SAM-dependent methyltransferase [Bryobacteraceae bacterium]|jgi:SAM-dependent methyltransferase|nr:class I SAM-dependent methyltransferase [Bryobacteraceae bacterium]